MIDLFTNGVITGVVNRLEDAKGVATDQSKITQFTYQKTSDTTFQVNIKLAVTGGTVQVVADIDTGA